MTWNSTNRMNDKLKISGHKWIFCVTHYFLLLQDFDLCVSCYIKEGHPHKMDKLGFDLDDGTLQPTEKQASPQVMTFSIITLIWKYFVEIMLTWPLLSAFIHFAGGAKTIYSEMHSVAGTRVSMSRCQLQVTKLSAHETSCSAHKSLQDESKWKLSHLQTTYRAVLLSRKILSGKELMWQFFIHKNYHK